jgi:hypothetical protein
LGKELKEPPDVVAKRKIPAHAESRTHIVQLVTSHDIHGNAGGLLMQSSGTGY